MAIRRVRSVIGDIEARVGHCLRIGQRDHQSLAHGFGITDQRFQSRVWPLARFQFRQRRTVHARQFCQLRKAQALFLSGSRSCRSNSANWS